MTEESTMVREKKKCLHRNENLSGMKITKHVCLLILRQWWEARERGGREKKKRGGQTVLSVEKLYAAMESGMLS